MARSYLRLIRKAHRLRQHEMAEKLGISVTHYKSIELGRFDPSYKVMARFFERFPEYKNWAYQVFQKDDKSAKEITVLKTPQITERVIVKTDWGRK